ncbi:DUF6520 family protein [Cesiribacter andamanensis]|uniref:Uncharacterized protein n=1 Tax=Cesiribacter andamanensis AMV16 TaxID=1279009 RepID=M7N129_9BACT|nr:DUF6520 family protein [Cesiribacter andamanensis]EMR00916.1 hypothetical protein ADICEAN_03963 [Cesiribacter andamanensis AMV16]EMR01010.1 hypothetical protein ADICEAN_03859 [Cesiribacter andamanensis AMV16]
MKKIKNYLAVMAFAAASLGAFAFSPQQSPDPNKILYGNQNGNWIVLQSGQSFRCVTAPIICVAQFENDDPTQPMTYSRTGELKL